MGSNASRTTEFFDDSGEYEGIIGPDLPMPRRSHCSVFADPGDDFWIIGGRVGDYENANYSGLMTDGNGSKYICSLNSKVFSFRNFAFQCSI